MKTTNKLNVLAIIPARSGSKGLLNKNIRLLGDHPLIAYSIAAALLSDKIDRVIVSTDSEEYAEIAKKYGAEVPFIRPVNLAQDSSTDAGFFMHAFEWLAKNEGYIPDLVVHLRPSTPLRKTSMIDAGVTSLEQDLYATSLRSARKNHLTPYKMFKDQQGYLSPFLEFEAVQEFYNLPRQHFEDAYIPNGYIDVLRPRILIETNLLHGPNIKLFKTPVIPDIDTEQELSAANVLIDSGEYDEIIEYLSAKVTAGMM